jgi:uncharacterized protein (TIGR03546 family)
MLRIIARFLKILNSQAAPGQIGLGVCFGMVVGLTPLMSLHNLGVLLLVFVLRVNLSTFLLALALFSGCAYLLDPLFHSVGLFLLTAPSLEGVWTALYDVPLMRLTGFNHSIRMGSLFLSALLFAPAYLLVCALVRRYRELVLLRIRQWKVVQMLTASRLAGAYRALTGSGGGM